MGRSRRFEFQAWLKELPTAIPGRTQRQYGNLWFGTNLRGEGVVFSYNFEIARIFHEEKFILVSEAAYGLSHTTTVHLGAVQAPPGWVKLVCRSLSSPLRAFSELVGCEVPQEDFHNALLVWKAFMRSPSHSEAQAPKQYETARNEVKKFLSSSPSDKAGKLLQIELMIDKQLGE